jgi:hypothetical protein
MKVKLSKVNPDDYIRDPSARDILELMGMNIICSLYKRLEEEGGSNFGHLPAMSLCAKGQLGALNVESFCGFANDAWNGIHEGTLWKCSSPTTMEDDNSGLNV